MKPPANNDVLLFTSSRMVWSSGENGKPLAAQATGASLRASIRSKSTRGVAGVRALSVRLICRPVVIAVLPEGQSRCGRCPLSGFDDQFTVHHDMRDSGRGNGGGFITRRDMEIVQVK